MLEDLFWTALTRPPRDKELDALIPRLNQSENVRAELEDILWSLLNSKEFVFRW